MQLFLNLESYNFNGEKGNVLNSKHDLFNDEFYIESYEKLIMWLKDDIIIMHL